MLFVYVNTASINVGIHAVALEGSDNERVCHNRCSILQLSCFVNGQVPL